LFNTAREGFWVKLLQSGVGIIQFHQRQFLSRLGLYQTLTRGCRTSPLGGAIKLDTNSFFEDESVRLPSLATSEAGLAFAATSPPLWRKMKRILMLSGEINFFFLKTNNTNL